MDNQFTLEYHWNGKRHIMSFTRIKNEWYVLTPRRIRPIRKDGRYKGYSPRKMLWETITETEEEEIQQQQQQHKSQSQVTT